MAAYISTNPITLPGTGTWYGGDDWFNTTTLGFGLPGAGDTAVILSDTPTLSGAYINGPTIWMSTGTDSSLGLTATNSVIGAGPTFFMTGGTTSQPQLELNNSLLYANLYAQQGTGTIYVPSGAYGASFGTIIVGGVTGSTGTLQQATLNINAYGTWSNIGNMYVFANGTSQINTSQPLANYGAMSANNGSLVINEGGSQSSFTNHGQMYASNSGTITNDAILTSGWRRDSRRRHVHIGLDDEWVRHFQPGLRHDGVFAPLRRERILRRSCDL